MRDPREKTDGGPMSHARRKEYSQCTCHLLHKAFISYSRLITPSTVLLHNFLCVPGSKTCMNHTHHQVTTNSSVCVHWNPMFYLASCWVVCCPQKCSPSWFLVAQICKLRHSLLPRRHIPTVILCSPPISSTYQKTQSQAHRLANGEWHLLCHGWCFLGYYLWQ